MRQNVRFVLTTVALFGLTVHAVAQQKQKVSYKVPAANAKYTQQHAIDVGDVPGHQVRVFELHRTFPTDAPVINGVKLKEAWSRSTSDYIESNGASIGYTVYVLEDGDRFFAKTTTLGQADATGKRTSITVGHITGGTGKLAGIQGMTRASGSADLKAGTNETQAEIEYWFGK